MRMRPSPLVLLLMLVAAAGSGLVLEQGVNRRRAELAKARQDYLAALAETKVEFTTLLGLAARDRTLAQHLSWRLNHSVQSTLEAHLDKGRLDQLVLFDGGCKELGRAQVGQAIQQPCPFAPGQAPARVETLFWREDKGTPQLALVRSVPFANGAEVYLLGTLTLDGDWLARHGELKTRLERHGLTIGSPEKDTLLARVKDAGADAASLVSRRRLDAFLARLSAGESAYGSPLVWPSLVGIGLCALIAMGREKAAREAARQALETHLDWCRSQVPRVPEGAQGEGLDAARALITHALKLKNEQVQALSAQRQELALEVKTRDDEIARHRQRLAELAELDSLAVQLAHTSGAFLVRMERFRAQAGDLAAILDQGVATNSRAMATILGAWRDGIATRGSRKFIRSLSETPGPTPDRTELDEQLMQLQALAEGLLDQTRTTASLGQSLVDLANFAIRLAGLWRAIALKTHGEPPATSLLPPLLEAQGLVTLERSAAGQGGEPVFANLVNPGEAQALPPLPNSVWVAAFYRVYLALAELAPKGAVHIATRLRQDGDRMLLVVQAASRDESQPLQRRSDKLGGHLEGSRAILAPYGVTLTALPSLEGPFPVAIHWNREAATRERPAGKDPQAASLAT